MLKAIYSLHICLLKHTLMELNDKYHRGTVMLNRRHSTTHPHRDCFRQEIELISGFAASRLIIIVVKHSPEMPVSCA